MRFFALSALALASLVVNAQDPAASDSVATTTTSLTADPSNVSSIVDPGLSSSSAAASSSADDTSVTSATGTKKSSTKTSTSAASASTDDAASDVAAASIPSGISSGCSTFFNTLNKDSSLAKCLSPYYTATKAFATASGDKSAVSTALNSLCSSSACSTTIRSMLSGFLSACNDELVGSNPNTDVRKFYDELYLIYPMRQAICAKTSGSYCALKSATSNSAQVSDYKQAVLGGSDGISSFAQDGVPYLFTVASMDTSDLCTDCTQNILSSFASFESQVPYAFGLLNSPTLKGQKDLLSAVSSQCGSTFLETIKNAAADTSTNGSDMQRRFVGGAVTVLVGAMGAWIML